MSDWAKETARDQCKKRWNLKGKESANKLKDNLPQTECPISLFYLAKQTLHRSEDTNSHQQAINWLISAAQQGHNEAIELLKKCEKKCIGISADNKDEVRYCLSMTPGECAARKAARELFACLSNGGEHITPQQLERQMRKIYNLQRKRRGKGRNSLEATDSEELDSEYETVTDASAIDAIRANNRRKYFITEANLVSAASNYAAGRMPDFNDTLMVSVPHPQSLDHLPCMHRLIFHPAIFFTLLYHRFINVICSFSKLLPNNLLLGLLLLIWILCGNKGMLSICSFYISLIVMIWSTCKMLKTKQEFTDFRIWSGLFLRYGDQNIEADISENRFLRNNMKPYIFYFCAFICNLSVYPLVSDEWLMPSELTIISGAFVFVSVTAFMYNSSYYLDWLVLISFAINVLAKYPYEMDKVVSSRWRFLDLHVPTFSSFVIGNGIEFCLNCRTALYMLIPVFLILLAKRSNWHGTYTHLIPHCVTLSWLQICITTSQSATVFGVIRSTLALAGIILFLPLFGVVSLLIPVFVTIDWLGFSDSNLYWSATTIVFILIGLISYLLATNRISKKYMIILQILVCVLATSALVLPYITSIPKETKQLYNIGTNKSKILNNENFALESELSWDRFYTLCREPITQHANKVKAQMRCAHLNGLSVTWKGIVTRIQLGQVSNKIDNFIKNHLPLWMGSIFRCIFGDSINEELSCDLKNDNTCNDWIHVIQMIQQRTGYCTLHRWNIYEYEINVQISTTHFLKKSSEIILKASHEFGNFTQRLNRGDHVQFTGKLINTSQLTNIAFAQQIYVQFMECLNCADKEISLVRINQHGRSTVHARLQDLKRGIKYFLNALLNPLIIFK